MVWRFGWRCCSSLPEGLKIKFITFTFVVLMRKNFFILLIFSFTVVPVFGQYGRVTDSLLQVIATGPDDTNKATNLGRLSYRFRNTAADTSILLGKQAIALSEKLKYQPGLANGYKNTALGYYHKGIYRYALEFNFEAIKLFEALKDTGGVVACYNLVGHIYSQQKNFPKALEYYKKVLKRKRQVNNKPDIAVSHINIGNEYYYMKQYDMALENYYAAVKVQEGISDRRNLVLSYANIAAVFYDQALYDMALGYYRKSLELAESNDMKHMVPQCAQGLGQVLMRQRKYPEAEAMLLKALKAGRELHDKEQISECCGSLAELYKLRAEPAKAYEYLEMHSAYKDSIVNERSALQLQELQTEFEMEKQEKEIAMLVKDQELKDTQLSSQRSLLFFSIGGLAIVLIFSVFLYRNYSQKKKANGLLREQNTIINRKQQEITDSINYAKRIQDAVFPETYNVMDLFPGGGFGFAFPKDVVSGDFYWFAKVGDKALIAAADCTGHGVPGAFMSIIGTTMLNQAVQKEQLSDPSEILSYLNRNIKRALKQNNEQTESKDGMDIALVVADRTTNTISYAGANRPLYYFRKGVMTEHEPTKAAIAGFTNDDQEYKQHTFPYEKGDHFYIYTDGFTDQFGGPKGKKITTKRFKEFLASIQEKHMPDQKELIGHYFLDWKKETEQIDDVLVIGIRL